MSATSFSLFRFPILLSYLALATGSKGDVDEATSVKDTLVGAALGDLGLLLLLDLGGLRLDLTCSTKTPINNPRESQRRLGAWRRGLTGTSERSVNLSHFD
jgi:hypothetical protein